MKMYINVQRLSDVVPGIDIILQVHSQCYDFVFVLLIASRIFMLYQSVMEALNEGQNIKG